VTVPTRPRPAARAAGAVRAVAVPGVAGLCAAVLSAAVLSTAAPSAAVVAADLPPAPAPRPAPPPGSEGTAVAVRAAPWPLEVPGGGGARLLSALALTSTESRFGGLSGLVVSPDGGRATLISDRGTLFEGRLLREDGRLVGLGEVRAHHLRDRRDRPVPGQDSEGLAVAPDGGAWVSFEGDRPAVWRYAVPGGRARPAPTAPDFARLQRNGGLEALASAADGTLYAVPERSGDLARPFPVFRLRPGADAWDEAPGAWPRTPPHLPTGADVGPDGRLYVVERDVSLLGGFGARVRRAPLSDWPDFSPETVLDLRGGGIDNVESVAVWRAADGGLRMLLATDDNFAFWQRTLLLEFALDG
jgi:hypothetical protein